MDNYIRNDLYRLQELEQENEDLKEELELLKKKYYELLIRRN